MHVAYPPHFSKIYTFPRFPFFSLFGFSLLSEASIPQSPLFPISPSFQNILESGENVRLFQKTHASSAKISDDLLLAKTSHFSPLFRKIYYSPLFFKFLPDFVQFTSFVLRPPSLPMMHLCVI